jgi:hypothetical protein
MDVKRYTLTVGIVAMIVLATAGIRSSQQGASAPPPSSSAAARPAAPAERAPRPAAQPPTQAAFESVSKSLLFDTCGQCHDDVQMEAGLDLTQPYSVESLSTDRDLWEVILLKLKSKEMPPPDVEYPEAQINALVKFLESEFRRSDATMKPDPGRVTARRLNRTEYTNTIRDLLAVDFRAERNFPTDDSGEGFDNISEVLTVSPVLMEKYLSAAEQIASRAIGADPLPDPIEIEYSLRFKNLRRLNPSNVQASHRVDFDAEYELRLGLQGQRPADAKPVTLGFWVDGRLAHTMSVETKPSGLVYFNPYSEEKLRVPLTEGDHTLRLGFIDDEYIKTLPKENIYTDKVNKWISSVTIVGPFKSAIEKPSRKQILVCDPNTGTACVNQILTTLARRAYRRPVTRVEVQALSRFVRLAQAEGQSVEQGLALAIQAMLVSPHFLFHIERDRYPNDPNRIHRISDIELASRMSYFLWSSMPDDELLTLAERGQLRRPAVLDAQIARMLADARASALGENFAGQWLEIRNLDSIKPDPDRFKEWTPELRDAMKTETRMFFDAILRGNRPISDFLTARYTFLNEILAKFYGIEGVTGSEFRRVDLTTDERGGVLSQGSVLAVSSYPTRTSVVIRGKYILQNILGTPPPPPPPDVPALDEAALGTSTSLRGQMEQHRTNSICASCHSRMDPLGFGLENYDAIGKWRTTDGTFPVDASGVLPGGASFSGPAELRQVLNGMLPEFSRNLTEKMLIYALGRGLERYDRRTVLEITDKLAASGYGLQTLVGEIVRSLPFHSRRAEPRTAGVSARN